MNTIFDFIAESGMTNKSANGGMINPTMTRIMETFIAIVLNSSSPIPSSPENPNHTGVPTTSSLVKKGATEEVGVYLPRTALLVY